MAAKLIMNNLENFAKCAENLLIKVSRNLVVKQTTSAITSDSKLNMTLNYQFPENFKKCQSKSFQKIRFAYYNLYTNQEEKLMTEFFR